MRRLLLLAIGLSVLLWTAAARPDHARDIVSMSGVEACALSANPSTPIDTDLEWRAAHGALGPITESLWKSAPVHAALATSRTPHIFDTTRTVSAPDPPAVTAPPYLRHTPLLI